jgi:hypothetical protein
MNGGCILIGTECIENWTCSGWSRCNIGTQTRNCTDMEDCGTKEAKPITTFDCQINTLDVVYSPTLGVTFLPETSSLVIPMGEIMEFYVYAIETSILAEPIHVIVRWYGDNEKLKEEAGLMQVESTLELQTELTELSNSSLTGAAIIGNYDKIKAYVFDEYNEATIEWDVEYVDSDCTENWLCDWTLCDDKGFKYPTDCVDLNDCGTNVDYPKLEKCECAPQWECGEWSRCEADYSWSDVLEGKIKATGTQYRSCNDTTECYGSMVEEQYCNLTIPIEARKVEWCYEEYVELFDRETGELVARVKSSEINETVDIYFIISSFTGYCDYCYDDVQNYDEKGIDCGGLGCPPCEGMCGVYLQQGWNFVSFCSEPEDKSIEAVLKQIEGNYEYILEWDENTQKFKLYTEKVKEFTEFKRDKSYFIFYKGGSTNLDIAGTLYDDLNINLVKGWNSPVYPFMFKTQVKGDAFYDVRFDYILTWNKFAQEFDIYSTKSTDKRMSIDVGEGLFINTKGGTLRYVIG